MAPSRRLLTFVLAPALLAVGLSLPLMAQSTPAHRTAHAPTVTHSPHGARAATVRPAIAATHPAPAPLTIKANPFLPPPILIDGFFGDLTLSPKAPPTAPQGYAPLISAPDWQTYRTIFGTEADHLTSLRSSGQFAFAEKLIAAAGPGGPEKSGYSPDLRRYLLLRAAAIAYRNTGGFATADKAVTAYLALMDKHDPVQVGTLWSIANIMARTAVTPKPERIHYDAIAARANMQLALLMLDAEQIDAAQSIIRQVAYHEGWLKSDPATRAQIAQVRADVRQTVSMMDYLASLYNPAMHGDTAALTAIYLYGRYVKGNVALVANIPPRMPDSPLAQVVGALDAAQRGDVKADFKAAESLRTMAGSVPDARIRARTLYAAMQLYDAYMASPLTERDRVQRTLARIAREGVVADGAHKPATIDPFAPPAPPAAPAPAVPPTRLAMPSVLGVAAM